MNNTEKKGVFPFKNVIKNSIKVVRSTSHKYGHYYIEFYLSTKKLNKHYQILTTDSEIFDWWDDDSNLDKYHYAWNMIEKLIKDRLSNFEQKFNIKYI